MLTVSGDASFRRYFRLPLADGSLIAVDAPPEKENSRPFVAIARALRAHGVHVPEVLAADLACKTAGSPDHLLAERLALTIAGRARRLGL